MSNPNYWQTQSNQQPQQAQPSQPSQQAQQWQGNNAQNWAGGYAQPQPQQQPQPRQGYANPYGYQGAYQQPQGSRFYASPGASPQKRPERAAQKKHFAGAMLFAAIFAVTCLYGFILAGASNWQFSINANVKWLSIGLSLNTVFPLIIIITAALSGCFLVLGVSRDRFFWAAAIACWLWAVISVLNVLCLVTFPGFFDSFSAAEATFVVYCILTLVSQAVQAVAWLIIGIHLIIRSSRGAKNILASIVIIFSVIEYVYPLAFGINASSDMLGGSGFWAVLLLVVAGLFGILLSRCLAVMLYKPEK